MEDPAAVVLLWNDALMGDDGSSSFLPFPAETRVASGSRPRLPPFVRSEFFVSPVSHDETEPSDDGELPTSPADNRSEWLRDRPFLLGTGTAFIWSTITLVLEALRLRDWASDKRCGRRAEANRDSSWARGGELSDVTEV